MGWKEGNLVPGLRTLLSGDGVGGCCEAELIMGRGRNISMGRDSVQPYEKEKPSNIFFKYVMSSWQILI